MVGLFDDLLAGAGPYFEQMTILIWMILRLVLLLAVIAYGLIVYRFDTKVNVREMSKGGRVITYTTKAKKFRDKTTGAPKLQFFGTMGFRGDIINEPPSECLVAYRGIGFFGARKMYDFVKKDGLYYPVNNFVLGKIEEVYDEERDKRRIIYTMQGSGLEVNRDYDAEQAIQNTLIEKATTYRNRKPTEIIASYALMIITIIGSFVMMWYAWKQFGNIAQAIASLQQPLKEGLVGAAQGIIGPG